MALFVVLCLFVGRPSDMFFLYEINITNSVGKNQGVDDFYYLMRFKNREDAEKEEKNDRNEKIDRNENR